MLRKTKLGKRMLAMVMCGALTFTSIVPVAASELPETAETQSEVIEDQNSVLKETPEESTVAEVSEDMSGGAKLILLK